MLDQSSDPHFQKTHAPDLNRKSKQWDLWHSWSVDCLSWIEELQNSNSIYHDDPKAVTEEVEAVLNASKSLLPPLPQGSVLLEISVGPGGQEACAWKDMIVAMYVKWCSALSMPVEIVEHDKREASPSILKIDHSKAMAVFAQEQGTHRMIRNSPFDKDRRTHTSFVHVLVGRDKDVPSQEILMDKDIHIDVMRSSGAGGQHVNKTESGVRMIHLPTKIQVVCKRGRSQHANKKTAWNLLQAKLDRHNQLKHQESQLLLTPQERGWGQQIRTYHFIDNRVSDHDTKQTYHDVARFMEGKDLDQAGLRRAQP